MINEVPPLHRPGRLEPQPPQIRASVAILASVSSIVEAAAQVASRVLTDSGHMKQMHPDLQADMLRLCDAVFDTDYRLTEHES